MRSEPVGPSIGLSSESPGASFEDLFRSVMPGLIALGTVKTGSPDTARELAQETMLRAHRNWSDVSQFDAPAAWCRVVMARLLIDHHRSTAAERRATERLEVRSGLQSHSSNVDTGMLDRWHQLISVLPDSQQVIVAMYYGADLSIAEIAADLGRGEGAIKAALFKARRTMRKRLVDHVRPDAQPDSGHTSEVDDD